MERGVDLARAVAAGHGFPQDPVDAVHQRGSVNYVFIVGAGADRFVIRFARDPQRADEFAAERWCAQRAAAQGIPTAEVVAVGILEGVPYGVQRFVTGKPGDSVTGSELWSALGRYGRVINAISADDSAPTGLFTRFGRDLPSAWNAHVEYNLGELDATDPLLRMGVYSSQQQDRLRKTLTELSEIPMRFGLSHGDLSIRNLLLPAGESPVLIDWGSASFGPVPLTDLLLLDRDARNAGSPSDAEFHAFAEAAGVDLEQVRGTLNAYRQLHLLDLVRWATDQRPERLDHAIDDLTSAL